jgi:hypothetical protein
MALAKPLQAMDANPIAGVIFLDVTSAIAPNTAIDTVKRNPVQGFETFRRESSGLIINCLLPGALVGLAALGLKKSIMGEEFKDLPAHKIWASKDTLDAASSTWKSIDQNKSEKAKVREFLQKSFDAVTPNSQSRLVLEKDNKELLQKRDKALDNLAEAVFDKSNKKFGISDKKLNELNKELATLYGQSKSIEVKHGNKTFNTGMKNYIRDTFALSKTYIDKSVNHNNIDKLTNKLKKLNVVKSSATMIGVGILALSMQHINRRITEKVSGRKGYSGYKDLSVSDDEIKESKRGLSVGKVLSSAWFASLALVSMGKPTAGMFNFAAPTTTMNQARSLSLATDIGRVNAADDKNELKDTTARDTVIFMNLYVLGDYVQKGVVDLTQKFYKKKHGVDLNLMNESQKINKDDNLFQKLGKWVKGKSIKSFEEVEGTASKANTQLRKNVITAANISGLAYSLVALGIFTPLLIARMTNNNRKKQISKLEDPQTSQAPTLTGNKQTNPTPKQKNIKTGKAFDNFKN